MPTRRILGVDFFTGPLEDAVCAAIGGAHGVSLSEKLKFKEPEGPNGSEGSPLNLKLKSSSGAGGATLVVAPSAPGLAVDLVKSASYREALTTADLVLTDSGFMVLLWRLFTGEKLPRHSGLKFLRAVLDRPELKQPGAVFWVMPSAEEDVRNRAWLTSQGFPVTADDVYLAPHYPAGPIRDDELVRRIDARRPRVVMLAIGGGVQERVGLMLREQIGNLKPETGNLKCEDIQTQASSFSPQVSGLTSQASSLSPQVSDLKSQVSGPSPQVSDLKSQVSGLSPQPSGPSPQVSALSPQVSGPSPQVSALRSPLPPHGPSILCLGAAIAFLTGGQANIPPWADKLILGWLLRLLSNPRKFWRRYWDAIGLVRILRRNRENLPPLRGA